MQGFDERRSVCLADRPVLVAMLFGLASLVSLQPNALFTLGILLVPSIVLCLGGLFERQLLRIQSISVKFAYYASRGIVLFGCCCHLVFNDESKFFCRESSTFTGLHSLTSLMLYGGHSRSPLMKVRHVFFLRAWSFLVAFCALGNRSLPRLFLCIPFFDNAVCCRCYSGRLYQTFSYGLFGIRTNIV